MIRKYLSIYLKLGTFGLGKWWKMCKNPDKKIRSCIVWNYCALSSNPSFVCVCVCVCVCVSSVSSRWRRPGWRLWLPTSSSACRCCCCLSRCSGSPNPSCTASSSTSPSPPSTETRCATAWPSSSRSRWETMSVCVCVCVCYHMSIAGLCRSNSWLAARCWRTRHWVKKKNNLQIKFFFYFLFFYLFYSTRWEWNKTDLSVN